MTRFHYGIVIVITGMLCIMACLGFSRFVLGMILPSLSRDLSLSYMQMGSLSSANFVGYLLSAFVAGAVTQFLGARWTIALGLFLCSGSMLVISLLDGFYLIMALYFLTGIGSAMANIAIMGLVSAWFTQSYRGRSAGVMVIGSGFAIAISGVVFPLLNDMYQSAGWRVSWALSAGIVFVVASLATVLIRNTPHELGLKPVGAQMQANDHSILQELNLNIYTDKMLYILSAIYFLFGISYVIYVTFIVSALIYDYGLAEQIAGYFWSFTGILSLVSGPLFGYVSDKIGRARGLMIVFALQTVSYLLIFLALHVSTLLLAITLFGITAWSVPSIMAATVGDYYGQYKASEAFGFITFVFAVGQALGPMLAGAIAELTKGFGYSFLVAVIAGVVALIGCLFIKPPAYRGI